MREPRDKIYQAETRIEILQKLMEGNISQIVHLNYY